MSNYRQDPTLFFMMVAVLLLVLVLLVLGLLGFTIVRGGNAQPPEPAAEQVVSAELQTDDQPPPTPVPVSTNVPAPTAVAASTEAPAPTSVPTAPPVATLPPPTIVPTPGPDVMLGMAPREIDCELTTQVVAQMLAQDFGLDVEMRSFDSADTLFEGLENKEADITFCFIDPDDRKQIAGDDGTRLGFIRQIGSYYWNSGDGKLQIWANGAAKAFVRENHPCVLQYLESVKLSDGDIEAASAAEWLDANSETASSWISCSQ